MQSKVAHPFQFLLRSPRDRGFVLRFSNLWLCTVLMLGLWTGSAPAGPLNPPPGPIAPTAKPLAEVEPRIAINATNTPGDADSLFRITQPGSYYLISNVIGVAGKHGIEIAADSVVLDLSGFAVISSGIGLDGVTTAGLARVSITVKGGVVSAWGNGGVDLAGTGHIVENVHARVNGVTGISTGGSSVIAKCQASGNVLDGFAIGMNSAITSCVAEGNGQAGFLASQTTIMSCAATGNNGGGFVIGGFSTVSNCTSVSNQGTGISGGFSNTVNRCSVVQNGSNGISVTYGSSVLDCSVQTSDLDGIRVTSSCVISGNNCIQNGFSTNDGAGIHVTGSDNRIEANNCNLADRGIDVDAPGNIIIRNSCKGNTNNWAIAANNVCGPILDRTAPGSAAISGNSAPDSTGSTHPNANFTY